MNEFRSAAKALPRRRSKLFFAVLVAFAACSTLADDAVVVNSSADKSEVRRHKYVVGSHGEVFYELTEIVRTWPDRDETILLVRDIGNDDFLFDRLLVRDRQQLIATAGLSSVDRRTFVELSYTAPLPSETQKPDEHQNQVVHQTDLARIRSNGGAWDVLDAELQRDAEYRRRLAYDLRKGVSANLVEALERMRSTFFETPIGRALHSNLGQYVLYDAPLKSSGGQTATQDAIPDCSFDHAFGYDCSDAQKDAVKKAIDTARSLDEY
jgi:hypothetical protein